MSQPAVSHQIKILEREIGVTLFEKSGARLRMTEAGRILLPWARSLSSTQQPVQVLPGQ